MPDIFGLFRDKSSPALAPGGLKDRADAARDRGDWAEAAELYRAAVETRPDHVGLRVQWGNMLKEARRLGEAEAAYRSALSLDPGAADTWLQLGHALKLMGRASDAIDAYAEAARRQPLMTAARDELVAMGARDRLPAEAYGPERAAQALSRVRDLEAALAAARQELGTVSAYPPEAWDALRRAWPMPEAPPTSDVPATTVVVDGRGASPAALRTTLASLRGQSVADWRALVWIDAPLAEHPVGASPEADPRVRFASEPEAFGLKTPAAVVAVGAHLDPAALAWLGVAAARGPALVYADHDHGEEDWREGWRRRDPALQAAPDPDDLRTAPLPALIWLASGGAAEVLTGGLRAELVAAAEAGRALHLPLALATLAHGPRDAAPLDLPSPAVDPALRIRVVIPTRDQAAMLETCVESLIDKATAPDRLELVILDNRSVEPGTAAALARLAARPQVQIRPHDQAFNWSHMNNLAADGDAPILVFANNDMTMLSPGWDERLRRQLARPDVGVVGVRLLYPDGGVQHTGIVLGPGDGRPVHDGLGAAIDSGGPNGRWLRARAAAAVTGAFLAIRREVFAKVGGFDAAELAIAYNDLDLCLKVRAQGLRVIYDPAIELIHHESRTRGLNDTRDRIAWDDGELAALARRWGEALLRDPTVNPHWTSFGRRPFEGLRQPGAEDVLAWLDAQMAGLSSDAGPA